MYQNKNGDSFTKQRFQSVQNVVQVHQILRLPRKFDPPLPALEQRALGTAPVTRMKQCPMPCTCHAKRGSDPPPKVTKLLRLPRNMHIAPKNIKKDTARSMQARTHLCNTSLQEHVSCETSFENGGSRNSCTARITKRANLYETTLNQHQAFTLNIRTQV
jgi:hypothetical protein